MGTKATKQATLVIAAVLIGVIAVVGCPGCSIFDPGGQTRRALDQTASYGWDADQFTATFQGPQESKFRMYEGALILNEDGSVNVQASQVTAVLISEPSGSAAVSLGGIMASVALEQAKTAAALAEKIKP